MSRSVALAMTLLACSAPLRAQDTYGPIDAPAEEALKETETPPKATEPCEGEAKEDGVILVCRELPQTERYLSPLPKPVQSDKRTVPEIHEPPCWVTQKQGVCIRIGYAPEYPPMIDLTAFPDKLPEEVIEKISTAELDEEEQAKRAARHKPGERVPIDLSDADEKPPASKAD